VAAAALVRLAAQSGPATGCGAAVQSDPEPPGDLHPCQSFVAAVHIDRLERVQPQFGLQQVRSQAAAAQRNLDPVPDRHANMIS